MKKLLFILTYLALGTIVSFAESWSQAYDHIEELYNSEAYDEALRIALPFAQNGNVNAQNIVGCLYLDKKDIVNARSWFEKAIRQGDVRAMYNMGLSFDSVNTKRMFESSWVPVSLQDIDKAKYYYNMAMNTTDNSEKSKFDAYMNYAAILYKQEGKKEDAVKLLQSCLRSTEYGAIRRQLGGMFEEMDRPQDAFRMYRIGAEYGDMNSLYILGVAYMNPSSIKGLNMPEDKKAAIECFTKIAEINDPKFNDFFGSRTGRALRYLNSLYADLYFETYDEGYLNQSIKWGSRYVEDIFVDDELRKIYQEGLSDSKKFNTYEDWIKHIENKFAVDSDIDIDVPLNQSNRYDTYVLIVANENYEYESKVPFASRDGNIFFKYVNQSLGVPKENIKLITNATLNKVKYELNWLRDELDSHPNSKAIIYYAGHGLPSEDSTTSFLLPVDGFAKNVHSGIDIDDIISEVGSSNNQVVMIFDACFSGAKRDGKMLRASRGVAIKQPKPSLRNNTVIISACSGTETAYAYDDQQHGLFTYFLLKSIKESNGRITLGDLTDKVIGLVKKSSMDINHKIQTPSVTVGSSILQTWRNINL